MLFFHPETKKVQKVKTAKTRGQIIEVAKRLFQKFGFDKTSMEEIAQAAHRAKRSLYNHFADKETLFCTVVDEEMGAIHQKLQPLLENKNVPPLIRFREYLLSRYEVLAASEISHIVIASSASSGTPPRFEAMQNAAQKFENWEHTSFVALWEQDSNGRGNSSLPSPFNANAFADMAQMLLKSLDYSFFVQNKYNECKETYVFLVNLIINSLNNNIKENTI